CVRRGPAPRSADKVAAHPSDAGRRSGAAVQHARGSVARLRAAAPRWSALHRHESRYATNRSCRCRRRPRSAPAEGAAGGGGTLPTAWTRRFRHSAVLPVILTTEGRLTSTSVELNVA